MRHAVAGGERRPGELGKTDGKWSIISGSLTADGFGCIVCERRRRRIRA
jgi:hypothetical protein